MAEPEIPDRASEKKPEEKISDQELRNGSRLLENFERDFTQLISIIRRNPDVSRWDIPQWNAIPPLLKRRFSLQSLANLHKLSQALQSLHPLEHLQKNGVETVFREWSWHPMHAHRCFKDPAMHAILTLPMGLDILHQAAKFDPDAAVDAFPFAPCDRDDALLILRYAAKTLLDPKPNGITPIDRVKKLRALGQSHEDVRRALGGILLGITDPKRQKIFDLQETARLGRVSLIEDPETKDALTQFASIDDEYLENLEKEAMDRRNPHAEEIKKLLPDFRPEALFHKLIQDPTIAINFHVIYRNRKKWIKEDPSQSIKTDEEIVHMCVLASRALGSRGRFHSREEPLTQTEVKTEITNWKEMMRKIEKEEIIDGNLLLLCDNQLHPDVEIEGLSLPELERKTSHIPMKYLWHTPELFKKLKEYAKSKGRTFEYYIPTSSQSEEQVRETCLSLIINTRPPLVLGIISHGNENEFCIDYYRHITISATLLAAAFAARYRKYGRTTEKDRILHFHCLPYDMTQNFNFYRENFIPGNTGHPWQFSASENGQKPIPDPYLQKHDNPERLGMDETWQWFFDPKTGKGKTVKEFTDADSSGKGLTNPVLFIPRNDEKIQEKVTPFPISDHQHRQEKDKAIG